LFPPQLRPLFACPPAGPRAGGEVRAHASATGKIEPGQSISLLLRPDDVVHDDASQLMAQVSEEGVRGAEFLYTLQLDDGNRVLSLVPSHHNH